MEKRKPRKYTEQFKRQAVQLSEDLGSPSRAAKQLGVPAATVHNWKWKLNAGHALKVGSKKSIQASSPAGAEEENQRLRRENAELKKVNHILKAAAAIFTRDHLS